MKTHWFSKALRLLLATVASSAATAMADIQVRLSVKFILNFDGSRPAVQPLEGGNEIGTQATFNAAVTQGNGVLTATARGYQVKVVEYVDIQPPAPSGQPTDYWFNLPARSNKQTIENAALAAPTTWGWNATAINIYVNNSRSGQCSLVGQGGAIALGDPILGLGTLIHEIGHVFDLRHTHVTDNNNSVGDWADGDGLSETLPDDADASALDIANQYPTATQKQRDDLYYNVMSYHQEERLLPVQMDIWTMNANRSRAVFCNGKTWFVASGGWDGAAGDSVTTAFATVPRALASVGTRNDIILFRYSGSFSAPSGGVLNTPCTLRAASGPVTIHFP